jgi:hypothetical protein
MVHCSLHSLAPRKEAITLAPHQSANCPLFLKIRKMRLSPSRCRHVRVLHGASHPVSCQQFRQGASLKSPEDKGLTLSHTCLVKQVAVLAENRWWWQGCRVSVCFLYVTCIIGGALSQRFFGAVGTALGGTKGRSAPSVMARFRLHFLWLCCALNKLFIRLIRATLGRTERRTAPSMMTGLRLRLLRHRGAQPPQHPYPKAHTPDSKTVPRTTHN